MNIDLLTRTMIGFVAERLSQEKGLFVNEMTKDDIIGLFYEQTKSSQFDQVVATLDRPYWNDQVVKSSITYYIYYAKGKKYFPIAAVRWAELVNLKNKHQDKLDKSLRKTLSQILVETAKSDYPKLDHEFPIKLIQSLKSFEKKSTSFKFRAECLSDVQALYNLIDFQKAVDKMTIIKDCHGFPDVDVEFASELSMDDILKLMAAIPNSHVMTGSLDTADKYTGKCFREESITAKKNPKVNQLAIPESWIVESPEKAVNDTFLEAVLNEDIPTIRKYIGQVKDFTIPFIEAASKGKLLSLKEFEPIGEQLNGVAISRGLSKSSENGHLECVKYLLGWYKQSKEYRKIDEIEDHANVFISAAIGNQMEILKYILGFKLIDDQAINDAFIEVVQCERPSLPMLKLLYKMDITLDVINKAIDATKNCEKETQRIMCLQLNDFKKIKNRQIYQENQQE